MTKSVIYQILNLITGKMYIGSAVDYELRWKNHIVALNNNTHINKYLQSAWNKYGLSFFEFSIIETVEDKSKLLEIEQKWLDATKCYDRNIGYNLSRKSSSRFGVKASNETRMKLSAIRKGKKRSEEFKKKISSSWKNRKVSDEAKQKMSLSHLGKIQSEEFKIKMSERLKGNGFAKGAKRTKAHIDAMAAGRRKARNLKIVGI